MVMACQANVGVDPRPSREISQKKDEGLNPAKYKEAKRCTSVAADTPETLAAPKRAACCKNACNNVTPEEHTNRKP